MVQRTGNENMNWRENVSDTSKAFCIEMYSVSRTVVRKMQLY